MARVKTVWTVTGPIFDKTAEQLVQATVMQGSVTGDRTALADNNLKADIQTILSEMRRHGAKLSDYSVVLEIVPDDRIYYKLIEVA